MTFNKLRLYLFPDFAGTPPPTQFTEGIPVPSYSRSVTSYPHQHQQQQQQQQRLAAHTHDAEHSLLPIDSNPSKLEGVSMGAAHVQSETFHTNGSAVTSHWQTMQQMPTRVS